MTKVEAICPKIPLWPLKWLLGDLSCFQYPIRQNGAMKTRVAVAMSGEGDSSVTAALFILTGPVNLFMVSS